MCLPKSFMARGRVLNEAGNFIMWEFMSLAKQGNVSIPQTSPTHARGCSLQCCSIQYEKTVNNLSVR